VPANLGLTDVDYAKTDSAKVATIVYVPGAAGTSQGRWYAGVGRGKVGAVLVSTDGMNWKRMAGALAGKALPAFTGANADQSALADPRSTGNLLASDGTYLYAASYENGVYRCRLDANVLDSCADGTAPQVWTPIGLGQVSDGTSTAKHYLRSLALSPDASRLYVASADLTVVDATGQVTGQATSVQYLDAPASASSSATWSSVASAPAGVEELRYIAANTPSGPQRFLYAVGAAGVHRLIAGSRATSTPTFEPVVTAGLMPDLKVLTADPARTGQWSAVDGAATANGSRIVLSSAFMPEPTSAFTGRRTAYVDVTETTGAPVVGTLTPLDRTTDRSSKPPVNPNVAGTNRPWDLLTSRTVAVVGQRQYIGSYVLVAPATSQTPATLWLAGKQGLYRRSWTTEPFSGNWDAAMNGLATTFTYNVSRELGTTATSVGWTDADLLLERTTGNLNEGKMCPPFGRDGVTAWGLTYQSDGTAWVATGDQSGSAYTLGQLYVGTAGASQCTWTDTHMEVVAGGSLRKAPAFAVSGRGANTVVTAYVSNVGIVRGTGSPTAITWKKFTSNLALRGASPSAHAEATKGVALVSLGQVVVVARPKTSSTVSQAWGVDVCTVSMASFSANCHPVTDGSSRIFGEEYNHLVVDPVTPGRVYWSSAGKGVWSFDVTTVAPGDTAPVAAVRENPSIYGGPMTGAPNGPGQLNLVVAPGKPSQIPVGEPLLWRRNLTLDSGFEPFTVAGGSAADDAVRRSAMPITGVLVTNKGPAAGAWRVYLTSLGNGVLSGTLSGF
jgi:hypothetical protein